MTDNSAQLYFNFDEYIRQGEPEAASAAQQWETAIGLQAVDGLTPSPFLLETARRNIEGEISMDEVQGLLRSYYASASNRSTMENNEEEADKAQESTQEAENSTQEMVESTQERILNEIRRCPSITRVQLASIIGITPDGIKKHLEKLKRAGIIQHVGATKKGQWVIIQK